MKDHIKTSIPGFTIRFAANKDIGLILEFIKKLAAYEKLSLEVEVTEANLEKYLFGDHPKAEVFFGEYENKPVGFALFFHNFSTFLGRPGIYLEDLFVNPESRGRDLAKRCLPF